MFFLAKEQMKLSSYDLSITQSSLVTRMEWKETEEETGNELGRTREKNGKEIMEETKNVSIPFQISSQILLIPLPISYIYSFCPILSHLLNLTVSFINAFPIASISLFAISYQLHEAF